MAGEDGLLGDVKAGLIRIMAGKCNAELPNDELKQLGKNSDLPVDSASGKSGAIFPANVI
jgi:hypothetical protein